MTQVHFTITSEFDQHPLSPAEAGDETPEQKIGRKVKEVQKAVSDVVRKAMEGFIPTVQNFLQPDPPDSRRELFQAPLVEVDVDSEGRIQKDGKICFPLMPSGQEAALYLSKKGALQYCRYEFRLELDSHKQPPPPVASQPQPFPPILSSRPPQPPILLPPYIQPRGKAFSSSPLASSASSQVPLPVQLAALPLPAPEPPHQPLLQLQLFHSQGAALAPPQPLAPPPQSPAQSLPQSLIPPSPSQPPSAHGTPLPLSQTQGNQFVPSPGVSVPPSPGFSLTFPLPPLPQSPLFHLLQPASLQSPGLLPGVMFSPHTAPPLPPPFHPPSSTPQALVGTPQQYSGGASPSQPDLAPPGAFVPPPPPRLMPSSVQPDSPSAQMPSDTADAQAQGTEEPQGPTFYSDNPSSNLEAPLCWLQHGQGQSVPHPYWQGEPELLLRLCVHIRDYREIDALCEKTLEPQTDVSSSFCCPRGGELDQKTESELMTLMYYVLTWLLREKEPSVDARFPLGESDHDLIIRTSFFFGKLHRTRRAKTSLARMANDMWLVAARLIPQSHPEIKADSLIEDLKLRLSLIMPDFAPQAQPGQRSQACAPSPSQSSPASPIYATPRRSGLSLGNMNSPFPRSPSGLRSSLSAIPPVNSAPASGPVPPGGGAPPNLPPPPSSSS